MPTLRIPEYVKDGLQKLAGLSSDEFQKLLFGLEKTGPKLKPAELAESLHGVVTDVDPKTLRHILEAVGSLLAAASHEEVPVGKLVTDVTETLKNPSDATVAFEGAELQARLMSLVEAKAVHITSRADDIQHEQPNSFTGVRILSDVRAVFDEPAREALGAVIIHQLKITYFCSGEYKDIYIAMDNSDLKSLRQAVDRAERKNDTLKGVLEKVSLTDLGSTEVS